MAEEGQQSIAVVVQTIMETLSDAVNQLILLVIALQEQNAVMPAHIPPAAEAVAGASTTLTDIARGLANDEYEDYPDIHDEITQASDEMDAAGAGLITAVNAINKTGDRKAGWDGLLQACRVISGKTIRILEIVYGAEIKRLLFIVDETLKMLDGTTADQAGSNPDTFAEKNSAVDEESPLLRKELESAGDSLANQSAQLIDTTNALLASPADPILKKKFNDEVKAIEDQIQRASSPLKEKLQEIKQRSNPEDLLPSKASHAPARPLSPGRQDKGSSLGVGERFIPTSGPIFNKPFERQPLLDAVANENKSIAEVAKAAIIKPPNTLAQHAKTLGENTDKLVDKAKNAADVLANEDAKRGVLNAAGELQKHGKEGVLAANEVSRNPSNRNARDQLSDALQNIGDDVELIADRLSDPLDSLIIAAKKEANALDVLGVASEHADPAAVVDAIKSLVQSQQKLIPLAYAVPASDPRKKLINNAANDLEKLLPQQVKLAKELLEESTPKKKKEHDAVAAAMDKALAQIIGKGPTGNEDNEGNMTEGDEERPLTELHTDLEKERRLGDQLANAAEKGDLRGVELALKDIVDMQSPIQSKARNAVSKIADPHQKKRISDALKDLDGLVSQQATVAREFASRPRDPAKKSKLDDINKKIDKGLSTIADAVANKTPEGAGPASGYGDLADLLAKEKQEAEGVAQAANKPAPTALKDVEQAARNIKGTHPKLLEKATAAARATADPRVQKDVQRALDDLAKLLPKQEEVAKDVAKAPQNKFKKNELDTTTGKVKDAIDEIARALGPLLLYNSPEAAKDAGELSRHLKKKKDLGERLLDTAAKGDAKGVDHALKDLQDNAVPVRTKARAAALKLPPGTKQQRVADLLKDIDELLPEQQAAANELVAKPRDPQKKTKLEDLNKDINQALDELTGLLDPTGSEGGKSPAVNSTGDDDLDRLLAKEQAVANQLADAANNPSNPQAKESVDQAAKDIQDTHPKLAAKATAAADKTGSPDVQKEVQKHLDALADLLPIQEEVAKGLTQHTKPQEAPQKQAELAGLTDKIQGALEGIKDALAGGNVKTPRSAARNLRPAPIEGAAEASKGTKKAKGLAAQAVDAAKKGDLRAVDHALKDLKDTNNSLPFKLRPVVGNHPDPAKQQLALGALRHVEPLIPQLEQATKDLARNFRDPAKKNKAEEILNQINKDLDTIAGVVDPLVGDSPAAGGDAGEVQKGAQKQQTLGGKLVDAANKGDLPGVNQALKDIRNTFEPLSGKARNAAEQVRIPDKKQKALKALTDLNTLLPKQDQAAKDLARNPKNPSKKAALDAVNKQVDNFLDDLANIVGDANKTGIPDLDDLIQKEKAYVAAANAAKGNPLEAARANKDAQEVFPKLAAKARGEAVRPSAQKRVEDALNNISNLLPKQEVAVKDLSGDSRSPAKKAALDNIQIYTLKLVKWAKKIIF